MLCVKDINAVIRQVPFQYALIAIRVLAPQINSIGVRQPKHRNAMGQVRRKVHRRDRTKALYLRSVILALIGQFNFFKFQSSQIGQKEPSDFNEVVLCWIVRVKQVEL